MKQKKRRRFDLDKFVMKPPKRLSDNAINNRLRQSTHHLTRKWLDEHLISQHNRCFYCRKPMPSGTATLDHVVPLSREGIHDQLNTVASCERCNKLKDNLMVDEFMPILAVTLKREKDELREYWIKKSRDEQ